MATASAMPTACSARRSPTAGRSNCRKPGSPTAIPGSSSAASAPSRSASAARSSRSPPRTAASSATSGSRPSASWPSPTTRRWSAGAASASTRCGCGRRMPIDPILLDAFNAGDHIGALRESNKAEALSRVLYPADSHAGRPGAAPAAGVFLLLRLAAGHRPAPSSASIGDLHVAAGQGGDPSQRHASGDRRRRADAAADGRPRHRFRRGLGHHQAAPSPTPTTRCCPKRWKAGRCRCSSGCCRATCRSSTRSTPRCCSRRARAGKFDDEQISRISLIEEDGERRVRMGNLAFVGSHSHQRRLGAAYRADEGDGLRRSAPALSGPHQQQDQRHHAAPLAVPVQSRPDRPDARGDRRRVPRRCRTR